jgi:hypothetical protein
VFDSEGSNELNTNELAYALCCTGESEEHRYGCQGLVFDSTRRGDDYGLLRLKQCFEAYSLFRKVDRATTTIVRELKHRYGASYQQLHIPEPSFSLTPYLPS